MHFAWIRQVLARFPPRRGARGTKDSVTEDERNFRARVLLAALRNTPEERKILCGEPADGVELSEQSELEGYKGRVIDELGVLGHSSAVPSLIELLRTDGNYLCVCAAFALQKIGDERAVEPLMDVLSDKARLWVARGAAAAALGHFGPKAAVALPALERALSYVVSSDTETWHELARDAVVDAIAHLRDPNAQCQLRGHGFRYEMWGIY